MSRAPVIVVPFDRGSAMPWEIAETAAEYGEVVFVCSATSPHIPAMLPLLDSIGSTLVVNNAEEALKDLEGHRVRGLITFSDTTLLLGATLARALDCPFHSPEVALALTDKLRQRECLRNGGLVVPRFDAPALPEMLPEAAARVGYPCVVKPRRSSEGRHTFRLTDPAATEDILPSLAKVWFDVGGFLVEELLLGDETAAGRGWGDYVSVESLVVEGTTNHLAVMGKFPLLEPFRERGHVFPSTLSTHATADVLGVATEAIAALGIRNGACHTELKLTSEGPRVIEVNGRLGAAVNHVVQLACGVSMLKLAVASAVGELAGLAATMTGIRPGREVSYQIKCYSEEPDSGVVTKVCGLDRVRRLRGVRMTLSLKKSGDRIHPGMGSASSIAHVYGVATNHHVLRHCFDVINSIASAEFKHS